MYIFFSFFFYLYLTVINEGVYLTYITIERVFLIQYETIHHVIPSLF